MTTTVDTPSRVTPRGDLEEADCLVRCVRLRAERRLAWLQGAGTRQPGADEADDVAAELQWQVEADAGREFGARIAEADAALEHVPCARFRRLCDLFALSPPERVLLLGVLAPLLDSGLLRWYAELQGRPWPTADLIARLFGLGRQAIWSRGFGLAAWGLVREGDAAPAEPPPLLADPALRFWLQGEVYVDFELLGYVEMLERRAPLEAWPVVALAARAQAALCRGQPIRLIVEGTAGSGRATFAATVAAQIGMRALGVTAPPAEAEWAQFWMLAQRQAIVTGAALVWRGNSPPWPRTVPPAPMQAMCIVPGEAVARDDRLLDERLELPGPSCDERLRLLRALVPESAAWPADAQSRVASRPTRVVGDLVRLAIYAPTGPVAAEHALRAAQADRLGEFAQRLETPFEWDDMVLPAGLKEGLQDLAYEARARLTFWENAAVRRLFPRERGLAVLFAGPPGTGKSMAAQVIARELDADLYRIDLATIISKYIGETAKNLKRIFARAAGMDAVLLFDEADALFAARTEVRDAHDRYANTDTNYLLQLMEDYAGMAVLATNRKNNIDTAFLRRIRYVFDFPRPTPAQRRELWHRLSAVLLGAAPAKTLAPALDLLGDTLDLSGAQIKGALLAGCFVARRRGAAATVADLVKGINRELAKEGRVLTPPEIQRITRHG